MWDLKSARYVPKLTILKAATTSLIKFTEIRYVDDLKLFPCVPTDTKLYNRDNSQVKQKEKSSLLVWKSSFELFITFNSDWSVAFESF